MYNRWFMDFAPEAFRKTRIKVTTDVKEALARTDNLKKITPDVLKSHPGVLPTFRMSTCPPIAVDRLIGLAGVPGNLVKKLEGNKIPSRMGPIELEENLVRICSIIQKMADPDLFVWINRKEPPTGEEIHRAATIVADRLCGSVSNPIIRNAQEKRQLSGIESWLESRGYARLQKDFSGDFREMPQGTYTFRMNVSVDAENRRKQVNIPIDTVIMRKTARNGDLPLLVEAKSAGDFTNPNKRRKEEAQKVNQLRTKYGRDLEFILFLCGYFDTGYLGYEAGEGIDWIWEHRIDDLGSFAL